MSVQVDVIFEEECDHCGERTTAPIFRFKFRDAYKQKQQMWIHQGCLDRLAMKAVKSLAKLVNQA